MKNIYIAMVMLGLVILSLGSVSALKIDYTSNDKAIEDMKVVFSDTILFGLIKTGEQGTMELKSHRSVQEVKEVSLGRDVNMYYDFDFREVYSNGLGDVTFINMKTGREVQRDWRFVYLANESRERDVYEEVCQESKELVKGNETNSTNCQSVVVGLETYMAETWLPYNSRDIPKGQIRIGIEVENKMGDWLDGIWTIGGKDISKHAQWESQGVEDFRLGVFSIQDNQDYTFEVELLTDIGIVTKIGTKTSGNFPSSYTQRRVTITQNGTTLAEKSYTQPGNVDWNYNISFSQEDYSANITKGTFEIRVRRISGSHTLRRTSGTHSFTGDIFKITNQQVTIDDEPDNVFVMQMEGWKINRKINLLSPTNNTFSNESTISFSANVTEFDGKLENVSLVLNGEIESTNTSGIEGVYSWNETLSEGEYIWQVIAYNEDDELVESENRTLTIDTTPFIEFVEPTPENNTNLSVAYIPVNVSLTETYFENVTFDFYKGGILNHSITFTDGTRFYNYTGCTCDNWAINVTTCTTTNKCNSTETRLIIIDILPPELELFSPLTNFTTLTLPMNVTLNFTATDLSNHLDSCWYDYNGTNTTFNCNTLQNVSISQEGWNEIDYYSNDTFGNEASGTAPFYVYYITRNATATNPITEGGVSSHSFYLNMSNITNFNATAELYWNGTSQGLGTKTILSNNALRFDKTLIVPSINGTSVNWTWVYNISGNPNVTNYNLTGSQTYIKVNITECGAGTYQILNYTLYDQDTRALGTTDNASIEVDLTLTSQANESLSWQYHATKSSSTSFLICLPSGALNNSAFELDSISKYSYQNHVVQYHYIESFNLTNESIPQTIKLYDLATEKSTSFLINYQDENYIYVEDAVIDVWRRYIGDGVFFSVEHGKTDASGQTRLHLVTEDIIYKFLVWQDGELVYTSPEYLALCQATPCQINLKKSVDDTNGFSERDNIIYDYDFDEDTRTASFTFATKDNTETTFNMTILSSNQYENTTACSTTLTTSGGQIDCIIPVEFTNTSYQTLIYQDGEYFGTAFESLAPNSMEIFGYTGLILTAISFLMLALMGISSGIATIIFGIIGLVFMGLIQIFESGSVFGMGSAILWLIVAGTIIIIKITKRRIQ